ncbi:hypothetical protein [Moorena sp. SIO3H5]|uniref:hypothetical protein n=1 Tax=Moorena sp. SIO3H5 TaxID=2607834 RepID=UPI0013BE1D0C|nr:hypothetical protein [Moorena sp. SIO3H5]NEO71714.1 hypothetical protein [Moorena sp. SIO3H5]
MANLIRQGQAHRVHLIFVKNNRSARSVGSLGILWRVGSVDSVIILLEFLSNCKSQMHPERLHQDKELKNLILYENV